MEETIFRQILMNMGKINGLFKNLKWWNLKIFNVKNLKF